MTTTADRSMTLATTEYPKLAELTGFTAAQINLVRQTVMPPDATIVELAWYLYNARRLDLEATLDQIYAIRYKQGDPIEIVVGINGYRKQADDSGVYAGSDDAVFEYEDVGQPKGAPSKATVTVWKIVSGVRVPFTASARWKEFYPGDGPIGAQYRKRPHNQLAVRAESHALRKGFPYQTSRLEPQPAPARWIEAAQEDEARRNDPRRVEALAAKHDEIWGAEYQDDGTGAEEGAVPMVTSTGSPEWKRWQAVVKAAHAAKIEVPAVDLPLSVEALNASIASLREAIADAEQAPLV